MFQTAPLEYLTRKISPLAPHDPNGCRMPFLLQTSRDTSKYSTKHAMNNPLLQRKPIEKQHRRRQVFLEKVRQVSADQKWESRSEQILRKDFLLRQKEWELEQARSAPEAAQDEDEAEKESTSTDEVEMVDRILLQENQEFEALVSSMQDNAIQEHHQRATISNYGSDEEEYDQLCMEVMSRHISAERKPNTVNDAPEQDQEMDTSVG